MNAEEAKCSEFKKLLILLKIKDPDRLGKIFIPDLKVVS
jgi:hypothetical protein